jgi:hypothetical protein
VSLSFELCAKAELSCDNAVCFALLRTASALVVAVSYALLALLTAVA